MIQTQFWISIKHLYFDNCEEYVNQTFSRSFKENGLVHEFTYVDIPQQNGVAKRKNRRVLEVCFKLQDTYCSKFILGEVVLTTYLINRLPSRVLNYKTQIEMMSSLFPFVPIMKSLNISCLWVCCLCAYSQTS